VSAPFIVCKRCEPALRELSELAKDHPQPSTKPMKTMVAGLSMGLPNR
jgi:hypothetical protein